jgi:acetyltransferase-like isoleucine patch superfamily enzyme
LTQKPDIRISFNKSEATSDVLVSGWSKPEPNGVWSAAQDCYLRVGGIDRSQRHTCTMVIRPFLALPAVKHQDLMVTVDDVEVHVHRLTGLDRIEFAIPEVLTPAPAQVRIGLRCPTAAIPARLGMSSDRRQLGVQLVSIEFITAAAAVEPHALDFTMPGGSMPTSEVLLAQDPIFNTPLPIQPAPPLVLRKISETTTPKPAAAQPATLQAGAPDAELGRKFGSDTKIGLAPLREQGIVVNVGRYSYGIPVVHYNRGDPKAVIEIGSFCSIARGCQIYIGTHGRHSYDRLTTFPLGMLFGPPAKADPSVATAGELSVRIGSDVWIGSDVTILAGVTIGHGTVIGAKSLVTSDVAPYSIVGGVPARLIRYRFIERQIDRLLALRWWEWDDAQVIAMLDAFYSTDIDSALATLEAVWHPRGISDIGLPGAVGTNLERDQGG